MKPTALNESRNQTFDIAKLLAIVLVVWGHILSGDKSLVMECITKCHMPIFYFISGYFLYSEICKYDTKELVRKKVFRLFLPYWIWSLLSFLVNSLSIIVHSHTVNMAQLGREAADIFVYSRSVWFFIELFFANIVFILLISLSERIRVSKWILIAGTYAVLVLAAPNELFAFYKFKWLFPFLILGYQTCRTGDERKENGNLYRKLGWLLCIGYVILNMFQLSGGGYNQQPYIVSFGNMSIRAIGSMILYTASGLIGVAAVFWVAERLSGTAMKSALADMGRYTIDIYVIHMFLLAFVKRFPQPRWNMLRYGLTVVYAFAVCWIIYMVSRFLLRKIKLYRYCLGEK